MKKFIFKNTHWITLGLVVINLIMSLANFTYTKPDMVALSFEVVAVLAVSYLVFHIEVEKRRKKEEK